MPKALGRVVEAEADDQRQRQRDLAGRRSLADREPFTEVVQADSGRDQQGELAVGRERQDPGRCSYSATAGAPGPIRFDGRVRRPIRRS